LTEFIALSSCCPWASNQRTIPSGAKINYFSFSGEYFWGPVFYDCRALPVRSAKVETNLAVTSKEESKRKDQGDVVSTFGMTVQDITPEIAQDLGITETGGVVVVDVKDGSPAGQGGIQRQDIILAVNTVKMSSMKDYVREISKKSAMKSILLLIRRGKSTLFVSLSK
jgi:membrane-associated protease RseP (regulator of RpoE activity)